MDCTGEIDSCICVPCMLARMPGVDVGVKWPTETDFNKYIEELEEEASHEIDDERFNEIKQDILDAIEFGFIPDNWEERCIEYENSIHH